MSETSTPAPALTDEQIDMKRVQIRAHDVDALCEAGDDYAAACGSFDRWLAAVEARAARREREKVKGELRAEARAMRARQSHVSSFINGILVAANMAVSGGVDHE